MRRALPIVVLAVLVLAGCGGGGSSSSKPDPALLKPATLTKKAPQLFDVTFHTTAGDFTLSVHRTWAPHGADRFYNLVKNHFYDGDKIFRVVPGFVVQFGISPFPEVSKAWQTATIPDDTITVHNERGAVAFASAGPDTRTTQIFIDLGNNTNLDVDQFAPFAAVTDGMDVVEKLYSGYGDKPTPEQGQMMTQGDAYFDKAWPKLDEIKTATISNASNPALP
ncbi:MAG: peptidylprolyl isomerase [Actinomycetota bacterium]